MQVGGERLIVLGAMERGKEGGCDDPGGRQRAPMTGSNFWDPSPTVRIIDIVVDTIHVYRFLTSWNELLCLVLRTFLRKRLREALREVARVNSIKLNHLSSRAWH